MLFPTPLGIRRFSICRKFRSPSDILTSFPTDCLTRLSKSPKSLSQILFRPFRGPHYGFPRTSEGRSGILWEVLSHCKKAVQAFLSQSATILSGLRRGRTGAHVEYFQNHGLIFLPSASKKKDILVGIIRISFATLQESGDNAASREAPPISKREHDSKTRRNTLMGPEPAPISQSPRR